MGLEQDPHAASAELESYLKRSRDNQAYADGLVRGESANGGVPPERLAASRAACRKFIADNGLS